MAIMTKLREIIIVDSQNFDLVDENFRDQEILKRKEADEKIVVGVKKWLFLKELDGFEVLHPEVSKYKTPQLKNVSDEIHPTLHPSRCFISCLIIQNVNFIKNKKD
jgi:hypothetical protein